MNDENSMQHLQDMLQIAEELVKTRDIRAKRAIALLQIQIGKMEYDDDPTSCQKVLRTMKLAVGILLGEE